MRPLLFALAVLAGSVLVFNYSADYQAGFYDGVVAARALGDAPFIEAFNARLLEVFGQDDPRARALWRTAGDLMTTDAAGMPLQAFHDPYAGHRDADDLGWV